MFKLLLFISTMALISCSNETVKQPKTSTESSKEPNLQQALGEKDFNVELNIDFNAKSFLHGETVQVGKALCDDAKIAFSIIKDKEIIKLHCTNNPDRSIDISYSATKQGDGYVLKLENFTFNNINPKGTVDFQEVSLEEILKSWRWFVNTADKTVETIATHDPEHLKDVQIDYEKRTITCMKDDKKQTLPIDLAASCSLLIGYIKSSPSKA